MAVVVVVGEGVFIKIFMRYPQGARRFIKSVDLYSPQ